jgi:hypothetical protein
MLVIAIVYNYSFESQRNHLKKIRAPPKNGGGADKQREFGVILGDTLKWFRMV